MRSPARVHIQERGDDLWVLELGGEIDLDTAGQIRASVLGVPTVNVVVDLAPVRFFSAAGISLLLELQARLASTGHRLDLVVPADGAHSLRVALSTQTLLPEWPTLSGAVNPVAA